jgi:hypothetical protein
VQASHAPPETAPAPAPERAAPAAEPLPLGLLSTQRVLSLQRTAGNAAVTRLLQRACADGQSAPGASETEPTSRTIFSVTLTTASRGYEGVTFTITNRDCELRFGWQLHGEGGGRSGADPQLVEDLLAALRWCYAEPGEFRIVLERNNRGDLRFSSWEPLQRFPPPRGVARAAQGENVVVVMGSPSPDQRHKLQFITAGLRETGNTVWFVERTGYEAAGVDLAEIERRAPGGRVRWITPENPLVGQLNALPAGSVRRLAIYSHGVEGFVTLRYGWSDKANYGLNRTDARAVDGRILSQGGIVDLESCQGGTNMDGGSLAQVLADTTGHNVEAWTGRTSYADVNAGTGPVRGSEYGLNSDALREWWVRNWVAGDTPREVTFSPAAR